MECPLCKHTGLDASVNQCPSCKADLSVYHALDTIESSFTKQKKTSLLFIILFIVALIACVAIFFLNQGDEVSTDQQEKVADCENMVEDLKAKNQQLGEKMTGLEAENARLKEEKAKPPKAKDVTHIIKEGESLFLIAKNYLGNGELYTKIAEDNGIEDPNMIIAGTEIIIKK